MAMRVAMLVVVVMVMMVLVVLVVVVVVPVGLRLGRRGRMLLLAHLLVRVTACCG